MRQFWFDVLTLVVYIAFMAAGLYLIKRFLDVMVKDAFDRAKVGYPARSTFESQT